MTAYTPPSQRELLDLRDFAIDVANGAALVARRERAAALAQGPDQKKHRHDLVTIADKRTQEYILGRIDDERPQDGFEGEEEDATRPSHNGIKWDVDPIDGTTNFIEGKYALSGVSLGASYNNDPKVGVVKNITSGALYHGVDGEGAYRDDERIHVTTLEDVADALVTWEGPTDNYTKRHQAAILQGLWPNVRDVRKAGSTALDLCMVAEGSVDGQFGHGHGIWDLTAGRVILGEAGGEIGKIPVINCPEGRRPELHDGFVAATPGIFPVLQRMISNIGSYDMEAAYRSSRGNSF